MTLLQCTALSAICADCPAVIVDQSNRDLRIDVYMASGINIYSQLLISTIRIVDINNCIVDINN